MEVRNVPLPGTQLGGPAQTDAASRVPPPGTDAGAPLARSAAGDSIAISPKARQAILVDGFVQRVLRMPDTRPDLVAAAQAALARGELDTPGAIHATADGILRAE